MADSDSKVSILSVDEDRYRILIESNPDPVVHLDLQGRILFANKAATDFSQMKADELPGRRILDILPPEEAALAANKFYLAIKTKQPFNHETRVILDGNELYHDACGVPVLSDDGEVTSVLLILHDITKQKETEKALRKSEVRFRDLAKLLPQGVFEIDLQRNLLFCNHSGSKLFGYTEEDVRDGFNILDAFVPEDRERVLRDITDVMTCQIEENQGKMYTALRKDGTEFFVAIYTSKIFNDGEVVGLRVIIADITKVKITEEALRKANKKLNLLTSITRHDILNQTTALSAYLWIIDQKLPENSTIHKEILTCEKISENIQKQITFTRDYDSLGLMAPKWQSVKETAEKNADLLGSHGLSFDISIGTSTIFADPMLDKVFYNLFDNAVRHGGNDLNNIRVYSRNAEDGTFILTVEDNGVGVPQEMKERIFDQGIGNNTGLGLFLVKEILDITGITIRECGTPGSGATFEMIIPKGRFRDVR